MLNWYLVYTKPKNEDCVAKKFFESGFEVLNPKLKERKYIRRKLQDAVSPLFPCYVFVKFDLLKNYRMIKYSRGVKKLVGADSMPAVVPEDIISSIRDRIEDGVIAIRAQKFETGEKVVIKAGPLQGFDAIFEKELKGMERVSILLKTINARVDIDPAFLAKIS